jgi:hypothetical protein
VPGSLKPAVEANPYCLYDIPHQRWLKTGVVLFPCLGHRDRIVFLKQPLDQRMMGLRANHREINRGTL